MFRHLHKIMCTGPFEGFQLTTSYCSGLHASYFMPATARLSTQNKIDCLKSGCHSLLAFDQIPGQLTLPSMLDFLGLVTAVV